jgi:glycerophosphoryl diester phosphodiesterase
MNKNWLIDKKFAHRGLHGSKNGCVENSLSAFNAAVINGYGFELDVLLSKDDKAMVFHDLTLDRLTDLGGKIITYNSDELIKFSLRNTKDKIPTLKNILSQFSGKAPILIEIKGDQHHHLKIANAVWQDVKNYTGQYAIMSFFPEIIKYFKAEHPEVLSGLVATTNESEDLPKEFFDQEWQIQLIIEKKIDFLAYDIRALPNRVSTYCKENTCFNLDSENGWSNSTSEKSC